MSLLQKPKPVVATLNKKLIIVLAAILLIAVLAIMIDALTPPKEAPLTSAPNLLSNAPATTPPADLSSLPSDYSQGTQINTLMSRNNAFSKQAEAQITALEGAQQTLQAQLSSLQQGGDGMGGLDSQDPMARQAMTSSIFFAGGAPTPNADQPGVTAATANAGKPADTTAGNLGSPNTYQQQNMQGQKLDFITSQPNKNIYNPNTVQYPASPYIVQAGSVIPAILQTKLVSNLPGVITALVSQDVYDSISGKYLLIPRGSKLIGEYNSSISYGQNQLQVKFTRLIRPDGSSIILPNQPGADNMGSTGIEDQVDNHWGKIVGAAVLSAVFNLPAIIATNQMQNSNTSTCTNGVCTVTPSLGSTVGASALQAAGQSASNVGNTVAQNALNIQPTVIINSGYQFSVMVTKDIVLPPYADSN